MLDLKDYHEQICSLNTHYIKEFLTTETNQTSPTEVPRIPLALRYILADEPATSLERTMSRDFSDFSKFPHQLFHRKSTNGCLCCK